MNNAGRQRVKIGHREVGDGCPVFITFEAGPTHDGVETAKILAGHAAEAGADAIKFQIVDPDRLVADRKQTISYEVLLDRRTGKTETIQESLYEVLCRRALTPAQWREVKAHCDGLKLAFFATVAFEDEIDLLASIGCHSIKIASGDVNHYPLIRRAARTGMSLQLDTGNSNLGEIEEAVGVIRKEGNEGIVIHQCPSGYPAHLDSINLRIISTLQQMFPYPVAFSDHSPGATMDIAAVAVGANLVEKTISLDRTTRSIEHIMSLEPPDMAQFTRTIREVERAMGTPRRILHEEERRRRNAIRRSTFLAVPAKQGSRLRDAQVTFRRPGFGLAPGEFESGGELRLRRDLPAGHMLQASDLE
ncbi:MAG TPA: N-acetylneuraminate synthase family protein [Burkholderiales bacterium]|nr:N-acetylneuraminate synthase family protein [Burkholderiales bacterium]